MPFCTRCGTRLSDGASFCGECGARVPVPSVSDEPIEGEVVLDEEAGGVEEDGEDVEVEDGEDKGEVDGDESTSEWEPSSSSTYKSEAGVGNVKHCPACGEIVGLNDFVCGACGFELKRVTDGSISDLYKKLEAIESQRPENEKVDLLRDRFGAKRTDALKANAIRYFPIPNTKEDLLEFLVMANANCKKDPGNATDVVSEAWKSKLDQAYDKAEILFADDANLDRIRELRARGTQEERSKERKETLGLVGACVFSLLVLLITIFGFRLM